MKIAVFYELDFGGARRAAHEFAKSFIQLGHAVDLYYVDAKERKDAAEYFNSIIFYSFQAVQWNGGDWQGRLYRDTVELFQLDQLHQKIARDIDKKEYDIVLVHPSRYTEAPFVLRHLRTPSIYYCQEPLRIVYEQIFDVPSNTSFLKKRYEDLCRFIRKHIDRMNIFAATKVVTTSRYIQRAVKRAYGISSVLCYMGVDLKRFYPSTKKKIDLLFIGAKEEFDGYFLFQDAVKHMKQKAKIQYLIRGENWTSNDRELRELYSSASLVMCFGYNEPFGLIPLEAMACGSAVVAIDEGGHKDSVIDGKTGILVPKDPKRIANVLDNLLLHPEKITAMSKNAFELVKKNWQWKHGAKQILQVYSTLHHRRPTKKLSSKT